MSNDPNAAVILVTLNTEVEAQLLVGQLEAEDIEAQSSGALTAGFRAEAPGGVQVLVRQADLEKAQAVLEAFRAESG